MRRFPPKLPTGREEIRKFAADKQTNLCRRALAQYR
jgi:hypothetical protein